MDRELKEREYREVVDELKEVNEEEHSITHWISTENTDRDGDIVRAKGMNDENFSKNPVVLYGHNYGSFPIGKSLWRTKTTRGGIKGILAKTQFAPTEEGKLVFELWKGGFLNAASIGFRVAEKEPIMDKDQWTGGYDIKKWELWEYSIVPVPANQDALRLAVDKGIDAPKILNPLRESLFESRLVSLEEGVKNFAPISEFQVRMAEMLKKYEDLESIIQTLQSEIERMKPPSPVETVARLSEEQMKNLAFEIARGAASRITGRA
jgi:HK97 family phage prohead protease